MKILTINASPKRITSASRYYLGLLNMQMLGCETKHIDLNHRSPEVYSEIFSHFNSIDALVIAFPVYVDGVPSHALRFMVEAEKFCKQNGCRFKLYVITNCGFYEARQCQNAINIMRSFCTAAGLEWGAAVGIGTGEMLGFALRVFIPLFVFTKLIISLPIFLLQGDLMGGLAGYPWIGALIPMSIYIVFSLGLFFSMWKMQRTIRHKKTIPDFYTRATLCPRFVFVIYG